ncbi:hypothetical protein EV378_3844 [Pseudonocardia endophytica]|uniref:Intracellular septation protein A n=1 Tax=Pseudonocardia endophytica TaxID=401976 RepID=A0A4R1HHX1_PSEEN|nr:hypothetical protein EV378_3844 [Pseudonocardia endophytica]
MTDTESPSSPSSRRWSVVKTMVPTLAMEVALPYLVYLVLHAWGLSEVVALAWSALPPVLSIGWQAWRSRRLGGVSVFVLASIAVGVAMALLAGSPQLAVARDAVPNLVMAVALGGSLLVARRPLVFYVVRAFGETYQPDLRSRMATAWAENPRFRQVLRRATAVGAVVLLAEAALRLVAAAVLPVAVALPVLQIQSFVVWAGLVLLLRRSIMRVVREGKAAQASDSASTRNVSRSDAMVAASPSNSSALTPSRHLRVNTTSEPVG